MTAPAEQQPEPHSWEAYSAAMSQALKDADLDRYRRLYSARTALSQRQAEERRRCALGWA